MTFKPQHSPEHLYFVAGSLLGWRPLFLREKLEYIHNNPVAKQWQLAERRDEYAYSSACFYDRGVEPIIAIDDVREWLIE